MNDKQERTGTNMIEDLSALVYETDVFPSSQRAKEILSRERTDTIALKTWVSGKLKGVKARLRLSEAGEERIEALSILDRCRRSVLATGPELRQRVLEKLQAFANSNPAAAQVYCRKFEGTPDEDLADLEAELLALDELSNKDGKPNS